MIQIPYLHPDLPPQFPAIERALTEPNGLLAFGGKLEPEWLITAYRNGIFPWYSDDEPILWWSPTPRSVIVPQETRFSRSLKKRIRQGEYEVTLDQAFEQVIQHCAEPRSSQAGTWITEDMQHAYIRMHELGYAHSFETWHDGELVGGLYGISLGLAFFGESMFSRRSDASKVAFAYLVSHLRNKDFGIIDSQVESDHMSSLGARAMDRTAFLNLLHEYCEQEQAKDCWILDPAFDPL